LGPVAQCTAKNTVTNQLTNYKVRATFTGGGKKKMKHSKVIVFWELFLVKAHKKVATARLPK